MATMTHRARSLLGALGQRDGRPERLIDRVDRGPYGRSMDKAWTSRPDARALVTGATGLVGRQLLAVLGGHAVATSRQASRGAGLEGVSEVIAWDGLSPLDDRALDKVEAVFHLAGEPVAEGRWTDEKKERIRRSRVDSTRAIVDAIRARTARPKVLVCASAVGIYGDRGDEELVEESRDGTGFLVDVCRAWEDEAARATELGVRVVSIRIGIVLSPKGGALAKMLPIFKTGLGGKLGDGEQWMPWIHLDDLVGLLRFAASAEDLSGPVNAAAPGVVTNADFTKAIGHVLHRPTIFRAPAFGLKLAMGEAGNVVLASQRVVPKRAKDAGFVFEHPAIEPALDDLLRETPESAEARS